MQILVSLVHLPHFESKKADVDLVLDGSLDGFRLTGFQVFTSHDDATLLNVTFPARKYGKPGGGEGFYTYLRPMVEGEMSVSETLKAAILAEYHAEKSKGNGPRAVAPRAKPKPAAAAPRLVDPRGVRPPRSAADLSAALAASAAAAEALQAGMQAGIDAASGGTPAPAVEAPAAPPRRKAPRRRQKPRRRPAPRPRARRRAKVRAPVRRRQAARKRPAKRRPARRARKGGRR